MLSMDEVRVLTRTVAGLCGIDGVSVEYQTTPPLPATSSPGGMDMDISPVPMHKGPYVAQVEIHSPTPLASPEDDEEMMLDSPAPIARRTQAEGQKLAESVSKGVFWGLGFVADLSVAAGS